MPQYRYSPLSQKPNVIRLLVLLPSRDKPEILRCELVEYTIRETDKANHPYEALSYVWGSMDKPQSIIIDDQKLEVTQNLYAALLRLRDREIPRIVWADAVCINQADEKEKGRQIQLMAAIYAKASRVLVWLGEAQDDSD
jgi:Heterokaryon incompatibility protein (HET)